jgi:ribosome-associated translation inhibitor RaiA
MIIKLDWLRCPPRKKWETQIHQTLEHFAALKPVSHAGIRVEENPDSGPRFRISMLLSIPGPDLAAQAHGQTFDEALSKLQASILRSLDRRAQRSRRNTGAPKGVKPQFRG